MSDPDPVVHEALRWLRFAEEDLAVALQLPTGTPPAPHHACWMSQQAAEKTLKAALLLEGIHFPFTHDLDTLRNLLPNSWSVRSTHVDLVELTEWAVGTKYPGDWPKPAEAEAIRAESEARAIQDSPAAEFRCAAL